MAAELQRLRAENDQLKQKLAARFPAQSGAAKQANEPLSWQPGSHGLSGLQISRYSRQMLLQSFGAEGMLTRARLRAAAE